MDFTSVERVVELLDVEKEPVGDIEPPAWWPSFSGDIVFEDVTVRYAPHLDPALSEVSFRLPAGSNTAIIGRTGSGKSTLALSLLATVVSEKGRIMIDNIDISRVDRQALRSRVVSSMSACCVALTPLADLPRPGARLVPWHYAQEPRPAVRVQRRRVRIGAPQDRRTPPVDAGHDSRRERQGAEPGAAAARRPRTSNAAAKCGRHSRRGMLLFCSPAR